MAVAMVSSHIALPLLHLPPTTTTFSLASYSFMRHMLSFLTFLLSLPLPTKFLPKTNMVSILSKNYFLPFFSTSPITCTLISFCSNESAFPSSFQHTKAWFFSLPLENFLSFSLVLSKPVSSSQAIKTTTKDGHEDEFLPLLSCGKGRHPFVFPHVWEDCTSLLESSYLRGRGRCHKDTTLHFYPFRVW